MFCWSSMKSLSKRATCLSIVGEFVGVPGVTALFKAEVTDSPRESHGDGNSSFLFAFDLIAIGPEF